MKLISTMDAANFWDPKSLETLIFSNFVGGAAIFTYENGKAEILRVNHKYVKELGMNMSEKDILGSDPWSIYDENNRNKYEDTIKKAIDNGNAHKLTEGDTKYLGAARLSEKTAQPHNDRPAHKRQFVLKKKYLQKIIDEISHSGIC